MHQPLKETKDTLVCQRFSGLRVHVRLEWPGVITRVYIVPANFHRGAALPALAEQIAGRMARDRNYWSTVVAMEWIYTPLACRRPTATTRVTRSRAGVLG